MRVRHLSIHNFRGIRAMNWPVPDRRLLCLVGCGDSTKSTVLEAVRRVLHPQWNLSFDDADFYQCLVEEPIMIDLLLGELPDEFRDLGSYGQWLSGWSLQDLSIHPEPGDGLEDVLHVRLKVERDLEPYWTVIRAGTDTGSVFRPNDRAKAAASLIGTTPDRHLTWSRGSILGQITEEGSLSASLAEVGRAAKAALDSRRGESLTVFDAVAAETEKMARSLGVFVEASYLAHLDTGAVDVRVGALALHDGPMPLRQLGLGSKRLLSTGISRGAKSTPHITLFDEIELGLEPHRIARLVQHLKADESGQYFLTTHSPVALRELEVEDLHVVHCAAGQTTIVRAAQPAIADAIQGRIRSNAEAFLAPKIMVCEGATEVGFVRGLDQLWQSAGHPSLAYQGVALVSAGGAPKIYSLSTDLRALSYDIAVLADSDGTDALTPAQLAALGQQSVGVIVWEGQVNTEGRVFRDVSWPAALAAYSLVRSASGSDASVLDQVETQYGPGFERDCSKWADTPELRLALSKAAHASGWFKTQSRAYAWVRAMAPWLSPEALVATALGRQVDALRAWIDRA